MNKLMARKSILTWIIYIDEPMHYVDEPTYGEEKHSDMDYVIDEPMNYVDEQTYGEEKQFRHAPCD
eukprot:TRINITY_DN2_c0_g1_i7.p3 TRINITY_DN2_c0_g1~~TRINITY_DN2_c0_g1_i7.p3  ORF type:complete len:66 (+),score=17.28 TRINITY_DN2_c0_g1_i7:107-304(+)